MMIERDLKPASLEVSYHRQRGVAALLRSVVIALAVMAPALREAQGQEVPINGPTDTGNNPVSINPFSNGLGGGVGPVDGIPNLANNIAGQINPVTAQVQAVNQIVQNPLEALSTMTAPGGSLGFGGDLSQFGSIINTGQNILDILESIWDLFGSVEDLFGLIANLNIRPVSLANLLPMVLGFGNPDGGSNDPFQPLGQVGITSLSSDDPPSTVISIPHTTGLTSIVENKLGPVVTNPAFASRASNLGTTAEDFALPRAPFAETIAGTLLGEASTVQRLAMAAAAPVVTGAIENQQASNEISNRFLDDKQVELENCERTTDNGECGRVLNCQRQLIAASNSGAGESGSTNTLRATRRWALKQCLDFPGGIDGLAGSTPTVENGSLNLDPSLGEYCLSASLCSDISYDPDVVSSTNQQKLEQQAFCMERVEFIRKYFGEVCCSVEPRGSSTAQPADPLRDALTGNQFVCTSYRPTYQSELMTNSAGEKVVGVPALVADETERRYTGIMYAIHARCQCENERCASAFLPECNPLKGNDKCGRAMQAAISAASGGAAGAADMCYERAFNKANSEFFSSNCQGWRRLMSSLSSEDFKFPEHGNALYHFALGNRQMQISGGRSRGQNDPLPCEVLEPSGEWGYLRIWGPDGIARTEPSRVPAVMTIAHILATTTATGHVLELREWISGFIQEKIGRGSGMAKGVYSFIDRQIPETFVQQYKENLDKLLAIFERLRLGMLSEDQGRISHARKENTGGF